MCLDEGVLLANGEDYVDEGGLMWKAEQGIRGECLRSGCSKYMVEVASFHAPAEICLRRE